ncbi:hypothetical protein B834_708 [Enterococcus mundtii 1A]|uniref:hypothetical protein n=1 Tax=Enterococcus TaxID=1350 RepID=UPI000A633736|nr:MULTISPECIES: hypothetical protein [Enterococcus]MDA9428240.1 hypothetical protein [Enterococcus mundtii 1A]MEC3942121.1 hypothetical protein [Enterococcus mundtii]
METIRQLIASIFGWLDSFALILCCITVFFLSLKVSSLEKEIKELKDVFQKHSK